MRMLLGAHMRILLRDRQSLFWALIFPLIFLTVFRLFSFDSLGRTEIALGGDMESPATAILLEVLTHADFVEVAAEQPADGVEARALMDDDGSEVDAVLLVTDASEGVPASVRLLQGIEDPIGAASQSAALQALVDAANQELSGVPRALTFEVESVEGDDYSFFRFLTPGIIGMGLMTFATISLAGSLARYREEGVLRRLRATPLPPSQFFASMVGVHLVVAFAQVLVLMVYGELLGAGILGSIGWFLPLAVAGNLIFLNLGVAIAGLVHGRYAVEGAANAVTMPMMFLSGTFFPTDTLPRAVQFLVEALPLTHLLRALRGVSLDGESIVDQWPQVLILGGWIIGTIILARLTFRLEDA